MTDSGMPGSTILALWLATLLSMKRRPVAFTLGPRPPRPIACRFKRARLPKTAGSLHESTSGWCRDDCIFRYTLLMENYVVILKLIRQVLVALGGSAAAVSVARAVPPAPNGIDLPQGYKDWRVIGVSHRTDNNTLRVILGNDHAIHASRAGQTNPWPDGAILAKIVLKDSNHEHWPAATVPGKMIHAEVMVKDSAKFAATGGWGYARWLGQDQIPYDKDADFAQECYLCHTPVQSNDYVFTTPIVIP